MPKGKEEKRTTFTAPKKAVARTINYKVIRNVSLQAWPIPTGGGDEVHLSPGATVAVPPNAITQRVLNLQKRRLIEIS